MYKCNNLERKGWNEFCHKVTKALSIDARRLCDFVAKKLFYAGLPRKPPGQTRGQKVVIPLCTIKNPLFIVFGDPNSPG